MKPRLPSDPEVGEMWDDFIWSGTQWEPRFDWRSWWLRLRIFVINVTRAEIANIKGVTDGSAAKPGQIGELLTSAATTGVTMASATAAVMTSLQLPAGDWDVDCVASFAFTGGWASTVYLDVVTDVNAPYPPTPSDGLGSWTHSLGPAIGFGGGSSFSVPVTQHLSATGVTLYLRGNVTLLTAGPVITGSGTIRARRMR